VTYKQIIEELRTRKCDSTIVALEYAVEQEKTSLVENTTKYKLRDQGRAAREAAREFYAEDITEQLNNRQELTPQQLLNHRRIAIAWAVAEVLRCARAQGGHNETRS
jgi:hypothetical protein